MENSRKLASAVAPLGSDQQNYFRATLKVPVLLRNAQGLEFHTVSTNVSSTGMGLDCLQDPLLFLGRLEIEFELEEGEPPVRARGRIIWARPAGRAGVRFLNFDSGSWFRLQAWLAARREEQGYPVQT
ncbi:MAG TPA: PilZ domain-containing protein [Terriglobales bacterium]|nr:PilZ domain-containing protein [Terriglobales bacterium]